MKKIKFIIFLLALSSCNQYLGTLDPDYTPTNEVTEIFSDYKIINHNSDVDFGDIIFPKAINRKNIFLIIPEINPIIQ